jgi:mycofactocin precursor
MVDKSAVLEREDEVLETPESPVATPDVAELVESDLLVEDVSIDGMCGVY